jgi:hypothetical protein
MVSLEFDYEKAKIQLWKTFWYGCGIQTEHTVKKSADAQLHSLPVRKA